MVGILRDPLTICHADYDDDIKELIAKQTHDNLVTYNTAEQSKRFIALAAHHPMVVSFAGQRRVDLKTCHRLAPGATVPADRECVYIRPPWFSRPLLPAESQRIASEYVAAVQRGRSLRASHNLRQTRVILMDLGSSYYDGWQGLQAAASAKWFVDSYVGRYPLRGLACFVIFALLWV